MNLADAEKNKLFIEILSQGIIRMLEVLYSRSIADELADEDYRLMNNLKELFHEFYSDDGNNMEALYVSGKYLEALITPAFRMKDN